jgi:hypothetical protein
MRVGMGMVATGTVPFMRAMLMRFRRSRPRLRLSPAVTVGLVRSHARAILNPSPSSCPQ